MHSLTCVPVVVCVVRKPCPCLSYSSEGTVLVPYFGVAITKGGGVESTKQQPCPVFVEEINCQHGVVWGNGCAPGAGGALVGQYAPD